MPLFCARHELVCLKNFSFGQLATVWLGTFVMLFRANRSLVGQETLMVFLVIKASNFTVFERLFGINY